MKIALANEVDMQRNFDEMHSVMKNLLDRFYHERRGCSSCHIFPVSNQTSPEFQRAPVATSFWTLVQIRDAEFGKHALVSTSQLNATSILSSICTTQSTIKFARRSKIVSTRRSELLLSGRAVPVIRVTRVYSTPNGSRVIFVYSSTRYQ